MKSIKALRAYLKTPAGRIQAGVFVSGGLAIQLLVWPDPWPLWGMWIGLLGQPLWFYTTIKARQYGVFLLSCWYTFAYLQGIWLKLG